MKKQIKKYGDTLVISFNKEEQRIYKLKEGTIIDIGDMVVVNGKSLPRVLRTRFKGKKK